MRGMGMCMMMVCVEVEYFTQVHMLLLMADVEVGTILCCDGSLGSYVRKIESA